MTPAGLSKCFEGIAASRFTDDMMLMPEREKQERRGGEPFALAGRCEETPDCNSWQRSATPGCAAASGGAAA